MDLYIIRKQLNMGIPLTSIKLRVTDYARVSTDSNEQKKSLKNQIEHFDEYIKNNPNWTYISGYVDEGITGTSDIKRNNFMQMIEDARNGKFDLIITKEISRFSRNTLDSIKYTRILLSYGVAVLFINDNINTALSDSELRLTIMASMAQDEIRRLSERVKFGMNHAIKRGEILGNNLLFGYRKDKETGNLKIVENEAKIVKEIYELYAVENETLSSIVKILNNRKNNKKKWYVSTISRMIENPKYKGYYCGKKAEIVDFMTKKKIYFNKKDWIVYEDKTKIPPIIDDRLWDVANARLFSRKKEFRMRKSNKNIYKNRYLYSAKIYCSEHNSVFHRKIFRKQTRDITWVCSEYLKKGKSFCASPNIRESELNIIFNHIILNLDINMEKVVNVLLKMYMKFKNEIIIESTIFQKRNLENILNSKIKAKNVNNEIISLLLNHIIVSKKNNDKNSIILNIFLNNKPHNLEKIVYKNNYKFKRGFDTSNTKKYDISYDVFVYL